MGTLLNVSFQRAQCRGDVIKVESYFQQEGRVGARRDWILTNVATGEQCGCATSSWVMINFKTRRLAKIPDSIKEEYHKLMPDPPKHCINPSEARLRLPELGDIPSWRDHRTSAVHMDMNDHVNNTAFLTWVLDSIPDEVQQTCMLAQYEVDYKAEGKHGVPCPHLLLACACQ